MKDARPLYDGVIFLDRHHKRMPKDEFGKIICFLLNYLEQDLEVDVDTSLLKYYSELCFSKVNLKDSGNNSLEQNITQLKILRTICARQD